MKQNINKVGGYWLNIYNDGGFAINWKLSKQNRIRAFNEMIKDVKKLIK